MARFGLITEGYTDQIIITYVLAGYFNNPDIEVDRLQPLRDPTDENLAASDGNWDKVFEYCRSSVFRKAFDQKDYYVIIHLDTDVFIGENVPKKYAISTRDEKGKELSIDELVNNLQGKLIDEMGKDFYEKNQNKIIFAIAVHSIECWLLPLYFSDNKKRKTVNCLSTLNQALETKYGFTIDAKKREYYDKASKEYRKKREFKKYKHSPSLKIFIQNVETKEIFFPEEEDW